MSDQKKDYKVGYGKPPKSGQFKKGQSGNAKGRPKGAKGILASLKRELEAKITVREGTREVCMSKAEALAKQLAAKGLKGEMPAMMAILKLDPELFGVTSGDAEPVTAPEEPEAVDYNILRDFLERAPANEEPVHDDDDDEHFKHWETEDDES
ncbi:hypothetical protein SAMN05444000_1352 [Shimia gijangensis]|uniref:DUF5681 domain-containing protein n=1 Tax=Shimia gijangensis TaxID=1470563 RepID=A0A1M6T4T7_9RHOB|nr:DUF5681 domain-containing protein [Shimia gijangensis]SHK51957.1 hypothetical protein SAMN05444000_1352 [Shimia gijangensis]